MTRVLFEPGTPQRVPVHLWAREVSDETVRQLVSLASQPYVIEHIASMADAHASDSIPIGTVFATEHAIVPAALGDDLGCGMSAWRVGVHADELDRPRCVSIIDRFERAIPATAHRGRGIDVPDAVFESALSTHALEHARTAIARRHYGTVGGGNHFVELDRDHDGELWLLVHSGSRGVGGAIAEHHARAIVTRGGRRFDALDMTMDLGAACLADCESAFVFAAANRARIAVRALEVIGDVLGCAIEPERRVDLHHNFVARETWRGRDLIVHRKGAIAAPPGSLALVPGSMGTASYLVEGLGAEVAFGSCSHGAGRVMRRSEARSRVSPQRFAHSMRHVVYPSRHARALVEEAPDAYRDIGTVLDDQRDLVKRVRRLEPIAVWKG